MHMGHVAMRVRDPPRSAAHLTDTLGLRRAFELDGELGLSCNERHHEVQLIASQEVGLDHVGIELEDERDLDRLRDALIADGARILSETPQEPGLAHAIRVQGPEDLVLELYTSMQREPLSVEHYMPPLARRFGHVNISTRDRAESQRFLCEVLGFRVSDMLGEDIRWLRCDRDHHGIALRQAAENTMHHYAFELQGWDAIERYCDRLALLGRSLIWGPGRHGPGRNLYTYAPDPENAIVEGYADLLVIADEANYVPIDWNSSGAGVLNLWGPPPPADYRDYGIRVLAAGG
jgi:catechol 2,3-dioxygenase-like lactoylglutathione lyase family enzyme